MIIHQFFVSYRCLRCHTCGILVFLVPRELSLWTLCSGGVTRFSMGICTTYDNFLASYIYWDLEILLYVMLYYFFLCMLSLILSYELKYFLFLCCFYIWNCGWWLFWYITCWKNNRRTLKLVYSVTCSRFRIFIFRMLIFELPFKAMSSLHKFNRFFMVQDLFQPFHYKVSSH